MKKYLIVVLCALALSPIATSAHYNTTGEKNKNEESRLNIGLFVKKDDDTKKDDKRKNKGEVKTNVNVNMGKRFFNNFNNSGKFMDWKIRFDAHKKFGMALENFDNIIARIDTRVAKMKTDGKNTATADTFIATAKTNLADAKNFQAQIKAIVDAHPANTDVTDAEKTQIKDLATKEKTSLKAVWENLVNAMKELHKIDMAAKTSATTTTTN